MKPYIFTTYIL